MQQPKRRSVYKDLIIGLVGIVIVVAGVGIGTGYFVTQRRVRHNLEQEADRYISYLVNSLEQLVWAMDDDTVKKIGQAFMTSDIFDFLEIISNEPGLRVVYPNRRTNEQALILREKPLIHEGQNIGHVRIGLSRTLYTEGLQHQLRSNLQLTALIIAALVLAVLFILRVSVLQSFKLLVEAAGAISRGDYNQQDVKIKYHETAMVYNQLVTMAERIKVREASLQKEIAQRQKRELQLRILTDNVPGAVMQVRCTRDHVLKNEFLNKKFTEIFGLEADQETVADDFFNHIPDAEKQAYAQSIRDAINNRAPWHYKGRFNRPDGKTIWFSSHSIPCEEGSDIVFYGILRDITERHQAEETLRRTQTIFNKAPMGIWQMGSKGEILNVNEQGCRSLGYTKEELCSMKVFDIDPDVDTERWEKSIDSLKETGTAVIESHHRRKNGDVFPIQVIQDLMILGEQECHVAFVQDITERKKNEAQLKNLFHELQESEERFKALHNASFGGIAIHDKGFIVECNQGLSELSGYSRDELMGMNGLQYLIAGRSRKMVKEKIASGCEKPYEAYALHKNGKEYPVRVTARNIPYKGRQVRTVEFRDITEEQTRTLELETQVAQKEKAMKQLAKSRSSLAEASRAAGMAEVATNVLHNVGNVLNSINTSSSILLDQLQNSRMVNIQKIVDMLPRSENELAEFLSRDPKGRQIPGYLESLARALQTEQQTMLKETEQLNAQTHHASQIIAMQQHYGRVHGVKEPLVLEQLIEDVIGMENKGLKQSGITLERQFESVPAITTDRHQIMQILLNLIVNAKNACNENDKEQGHIIVRLSCKNKNKIQIQIQDNGIGIAPENISRIFQHGFTTRSNGHGFGLHSGAITAKQLGGSLTAESTGPGCGATLTLTLPLSAQEKR